MDQKTLDALNEVVSAAFEKAKDKETFLKLLTNGLKKIKGDRIIAEFNIEDVDGGIILTVRDLHGEEHRFGIPL